MATEQKPLREFPKEMVHTILDYLPEDKVMQFIASNAVPCKEFELHNYMYNRIYNEIDMLQRKEDEPAGQLVPQGRDEPAGQLVPQGRDELGYFKALARITLGEKYSHVNITNLGKAIHIAGKDSVCIKTPILPSNVVMMKSLLRTTYDSLTGEWVPGTANTICLHDLWHCGTDRNLYECLCTDCLNHGLMRNREMLALLANPPKLFKETIKIYSSNLDANDITLKLLQILKDRNN